MQTSRPNIGYRLADYDHHLVHTLRDAGYWSALIGEQHLSSDPEDIGYDRVVEIDSNHAHDIAPATAALLREAVREPFFLSVGFFETHRDYFEPTSVRDALYSLPPANLPDTPATRRDMAAYKASARSLDQGVGAVLNALDEHDLADDTLVVFTTDHGLAFPGAKATLTDRGLGVLLIVRGPGGFHGGRVCDALVSQIDLFPTICELAGIATPEWARGRSLLPLVRREAVEVNDAIFGEITYHAAYDPQRAVRTRRYKYIRRFDNGHEGPVLANIDDSPSKEELLDHGLAARAVAAEELYDLVFDPNEAANLAGGVAYADIVADLRELLATWMAQTGDPLLEGPIEPRDGTELNLPKQRSATDPTIVVRR
jgi:N-sulfoglucosamine sulfohydrolase